jgi:hypothetical protein
MPGPDDKKEVNGQTEDDSVVRFPQFRVPLPGARDPYRDLGIGRMAMTLGIPKEQMTGHWCSRCKGIWFGYLLEVECPRCENRNR